MGLPSSALWSKPNGGRLWGEPAPGGGGLFHFKLSVRPMNERAEPVYVVDDDPRVRAALRCCSIRPACQWETYDGAAAFLAAYAPGRAGCLVLGRSDAEMTAAELPGRTESPRRRPAGRISDGSRRHPHHGAGDEGGAIDFLTNPVVGTQLLERVLPRGTKCPACASRLPITESLRERLGGADPARAGNHDAWWLPATPTRISARPAGISHRTVEVHRARVMQRPASRTGRTVPPGGGLRSSCPALIAFPRRARFAAPHILRAMQESQQFARTGIPLG